MNVRRGAVLLPLLLLFHAGPAWCAAAPRVRPLTLHAALRRVLARHPLVRAAEAEIEAARGLDVQARQWASPRLSYHYSTPTKNAALSELFEFPGKRALRAEAAELTAEEGDPTAAAIAAEEACDAQSGPGTVGQGAPNHVSVSANPAVITNGGATSTITATVTDQTGAAVSGDTVTFTMSGACGTLSATTAPTNAAGQATVTYSSPTVALVGFCTITATESNTATAPASLTRVAWRFGCRYPAATLRT